MDTTTQKTVRELAVEVPHATRVFEKYGIDYCCGGGSTLDSACAAKGVTAEDILKAISTETAEVARRDPAKQDWNQASLADLIDHITATHHLYVRQEGVRIQQLLAKVAGKHGQNHPETVRIQEVFAALAAELMSHLMKEENILFPYVRRLEEACLAGTPKPRPMFGSVQNPIHMMEIEHDSAGEALRTLARESNNYTPPDDACTTYKTCYAAMQAFEADLHQHIHLENNILFPKAIALEGAAV